MPATTVDISVTRHNLSSAELQDFQQAAKDAFRFLAESVGGVTARSHNAKSKRRMRQEDDMKGAATRLVDRLNALQSTRYSSVSRMRPWHCFVGRNLNMAVRMQKYACGKINVIGKPKQRKSGGNAEPLLKSALSIFIFRSAARTSNEVLRQSCRPDASELHNFDPDPDEQERTSVKALRNDMDQIKFGTLADLCRIALAKNMRRLTQVNNALPQNSGSSMRMSNAAASSAAMDSLDCVAKYIRARMTEMHDGPWHILATAPGPDGHSCHSVHIDPKSQDVATIYSNAAHGVCILAFRHTDDAGDPFFPGLFGEDGLFTNPRTSRAASAALMLVFLAVYLGIGWTTWLDCLNGGAQALDGVEGVSANCSDGDIVFSHRVEKVRTGFMIAALLLFIFSAIMKTILRVRDSKMRKAGKKQ